MLFFLIGFTKTHRFACNFPTAFFLSLWHFNFPVYLGFWFPVKSSRNGIVMAPEHSSELSITLHIVNECTRNAPIRYICFHKIRVCGLWIVDRFREIFHNGREAFSLFWPFDCTHSIEISGWHVCMRSNRKYWRRIGPFLVFGTIWHRDAHIQRVRYSGLADHNSWPNACDRVNGFRTRRPTTG